MRVIASSLMSLILLAGCGGGGTTATPTPTPAPPVATGPTVTDVQADRLSYKQTSTFKITGTGLDDSMTVTARNCSGLVLVANGTATEKSVRCTITATGQNNVSLDIKSSTGTALKSATFTVPEPRVTITTSLGTLVVELNPTAAPITVDNYLQYVKDGFYTNTIFHRVIKGFVAQGGWLTPTPAEQTGRRDPIVLESNKGLSNLRGTIAMARTAEPNTATSQFYFNLVDNTALDYVNATQPGYAVFGKVVTGLVEMDAIGNTPTATRYGLADVPVTDVVVKSVVQSQ